MNWLPPLCAIVGQAAIVAAACGNATGRLMPAIGMFFVGLAAALLSFVAGHMIRAFAIEWKKNREYKQGLKQRGLLAILAFALVCICSSADACPRCGIFGRGCRFVSHAMSYVAPVAAAPAVNQTQNLVFNNSYPTPFLQQGNSVYGYSLAAAPYSFDSTAYLDRAARFQELALETAQQGINGFNANAAAATALADAVDRRTKNAMVALAAINANQQNPVSTAASVAAAAAPVVQRFTLTLREGQAPVITTDPPRDPNVPRAPPQAFQAFAAGQALMEQCGRCHDGTGLHHEPKDVVLNGSRAIDQALYEKCLDQINQGKMPKGAPLTSGPVANAVRDDLKALIRGVAQ